MLPDVSQILVGAAFIALLWIGVSSKYMLIPISVSAWLLLALPYLVGNFLPQMWLYRTLWIILSIGLLTTYVLRIRRKEQLHTIDYFKISGVFVFTLYLLPTHYFLPDKYWMCWVFLTIIYPVLVYMYDRLKLTNLETSKRKFVIALIAQSVVTVTVLMYALVQRTQAIKNEGIAYEVQQQSVQMRQSCEELTKDMEGRLLECQESK